MKERPIIMQAHSVLATLAGRKTQTRRVIKWPFDIAKHHFIPAAVCMDGGGNWIIWEENSPGLAEFTKRAYPNADGFACPYGKPGDRLWIKEAWGYFGGEEYLYQKERNCVGYKADHITTEPIPGGSWRSPMFMPRWASRLTLEVVSVRAERVQSISEKDALAEGIQFPPLYADEPLPSRNYAIKAFSFLWDSINAKRGHPWSANDFVWVIEYRRLPDANNV